MDRSFFGGRKIAAPCLSSLLQPRFGHLERRLLVRDWLFHPLNVPLHVNYLLQWEVLIERQTVAAASAKPFFSPNVSASISTLLSLLGPKSVRNIQEGQVFWELACLLVKFSKNELRWPKSADSQVLVSIGAKPLVGHQTLSWKVKTNLMFSHTWVKYSEKIEWERNLLWCQEK